MVAVLTEVVVDAGDPAFARPTKPIGPVYTKGEARRLAAEHGWDVARDGAHYRRVVPSPQPHEIVELDAVATLLRAGSIVVCAGGGGIPVVREDGRLRGVEAVIDKDLTAALLAEQLGADQLIDPHRRPLRRARLGDGSAGADPTRHARGAAVPGLRSGVHGARRSRRRAVSSSEPEARPRSAPWRSSRTSSPAAVARTCTLL